MNSKKYLLSFMLIISVVSSVALAMEVITIIGRYERTPLQVFNLLDFRDRDYNRFEPIFRGGGGSSSSLEESFCNFLDGNKPQQCEGNPDASVFAVNGCSVPDNMPVAITSWQSTFSGACNNHDECYVTPGSSKSACDSNFGTDMDIVCITDPEISTHYKLQDSCFAASTSYELAVSHAPAASDIFEASQDDVKCDAWHELKDKYCE